MLEEVVVGDARRRREAAGPDRALLPGGAGRRELGATRDDDRPVRGGQHLVAGREAVGRLAGLDDMRRRLRVLAVPVLTVTVFAFCGLRSITTGSRFSAATDCSGPGDDLLRPRVEEVVGRRRALLARLDERQQVEEARVRNGVLLGVDRRAVERRRQVVELELGGLADHLRGLRRVVDRRQLDDDLVRPLLGDHRLGDAEPIDAVPDDADRVVHHRRRQLLALERLGLQHDLQAALDVEALVKRAVPRASGNGKEGDAGEGGDHEEDQRQMRAA